MEKSFAVLTTDDHPLVREAVALACESHPRLNLVGEASSGAETLTACATHDPDVVVLDLNLPDTYGADLIRTVKERFGVRVLVLTMTEDPQALFDCLSAGADGFLEKTIGVKELGETIAMIAAGEQAFTMEQRGQAQSRFGEIVRAAREQRRLEQALSKREIEVLGLIGEGLTTIQMASRLGISHGTVESHIKNLYRKLGVNSRVQAVITAQKFGLGGGRGPGPQKTSSDGGDLRISGEKRLSD